MKLLILILMNACLLNAAQNFDGITCESDIAKALIGRKLTISKVIDIEKKYQPLKLKLIGADDLDNGRNTILWSICGDKYLELENKKTFADVIKVPPTFNTVVVNCTRQDKKVEHVLALLKSDGANNVEVAWQVDLKKMKFVSLPVEGLTCPKPF